MTRFRSSLLRSALVAVALLAATGPALANQERARAAQARGDLRTAQIELRNAVRAAPNDAALRAALALASLDVGDADTAEKEARAALERGFDRAAATALIIRAQLGLNRAREILREFAEPAPGTDPTLAGQILAGRAAAQLALDQRADARRSAEAAVAIAPRLAEAQLVLSSALLQAGDRASAEAAVDAALQADPNSSPALLRKAAFLFERGEFRPAADLMGRVISAAPGNVPARIQRAETLLRLNDEAGARADVDAALRTAPGNLPASYMNAMLLARAQEWRQADEALTRLGAALVNLPDGLLLQATVKRSLNQTAQAFDAAQRYVARRPEDPRGAKLLASMDMEAGRFGPAAAVLNNLVGRGTADAEAFDMLGRAQLAAGRPRDAAEAFRRANEMVPNNPALLSRMAAARLASGDIAGMAQAAQTALGANPDGPAARLMLAMGAMARGDLDTAQAELGRLDEANRSGDAARLLDGYIRLMRFDAAGARGVFEGVLRDQRESVPARLGLARVASTQGQPEEAERLLGEVLRRDPSNQEAIGRLAATVLARGPRAATARTALEAAHAANPADATLTFALASVLAGLGEGERAATLLQSPALRNLPDLGPTVQLRLSEVRAAQERWPEAEAAARSALAEAPTMVAARRQLAFLLARRGDNRNAEATIEDGLRSAPGDPVLQGAAVAIARQAGGLDAALAAADRQTRRPGGMPAAATLRGDLLLAERRPAEAAEAFAAMAATAPSSILTLRQASALMNANRSAEAVTLLQNWLRTEPNDIAALELLAHIDLQQGRTAEAERNFRAVVDRAPQSALVLNNLAWLLQERGGPAELREAQILAERAFFLSPTAEVADTLGWILARGNEAPRAVPLLRQAAAGAVAGRSPAAPGITYRLAYALNQSGQRQEAIQVLEPLLAENATFPERAQAERLLATLRTGR